MKKKAKNYDILKIIDLYIEFFESKDSNSITKMLNNLKEQCLSLSEELEFCEFPIAIDVRDVVFLSFYIGHFCCQIEALLGGNTFFSNRLSAMIGRSNIISKRWEKRDKVIVELLKEAWVMWAAGDKALHSEMATYLLNKHKDSAKIISRKVLMRQLVPIADEFGRVHGKKGVKKEK